MKKGTTNNPNGRPKGKANKISGQLRDTLKTALTGELESLTGLLSECEPCDRLELIIKLLPYLMPKATNTETTPPKPSTDAAALIASTLQRLQAGSIAPEQAKAEFMAVDALLKVREQTEIMDKLAEIENKLSEGK